MYLKGLAVLPDAKTLSGLSESGERAVRDVCLNIAAAQPDTLVFVTADGAAFEDTLTVLYQPQVDGVAFELPLLDELHDLCFEADIPTLFLNDTQAKRYDVKPALSANTRAALNYIDKYFGRYKIAELTTANQSPYTLYKTGRVVRQAVEKSGKDNNKDVVIIALGCVNDSVKNALADKRYYDLLKMTDDDREKSGDGFAPLLLGLGALDGIATKPERTGENTFWVPYDLSVEDPTYESLLTRYDHEMAAKHEQKLADEKDSYVRLAAMTADRWITTGEPLDAADFLGDNIAADDQERLSHQAAGVYISVYKSGELRGQMGSVRPREENISREIIHSTIEAIAYDPRFLPVEAPELPELTFKVALIDPPEDVYDKSELDPAHDGLIAEKGLRYGVVLPGIPEINTPDEQIAAVKRNAGIPEYEADDERDLGGDKLMLRRFKAEIHRQR